MSEGAPGMVERPGYDALWGWFGLSRASWVTLPRVLMHEMSDAWQADMERLLREFGKAFPNAPIEQTRVNRIVGGKLASFPDWIGNYRHPRREEIDTARPDTALAPAAGEGW